MLQLELEAAAALSLADRVFIRKTMPNIVTCLSALSERTDTVKQGFNSYKRAFYLLSDMVSTNVRETFNHYH